MFDWITGWLESSGYLGIFALMLVENLFPPIPSELIMPLAGYMSARGDLALPLVIVAGTRGLGRGRALLVLRGAASSGCAACATWPSGTASG